MLWITKEHHWAIARDPLKINWIGKKADWIKFKTF